MKSKKKSKLNTPIDSTTTLYMLLCTNLMFLLNKSLKCYFGRIFKKSKTFYFINLLLIYN